ncbi:FAD:protein FMN transferase [Treponema primitia]|uniref:FAD:protein FMN transferase n=1 Tax=Treponema primitia TaxID=88058 RepID=UPI0004744D7A|nr:FAD:protein FMN transferase [Treponema primitia]
MRSTQRIGCLLCFILILFPGCSKPVPSQSEFILGTVCSVSLYDRGRQSVYREIFDRLREIESMMSANIENSDLGRINRASGIEAVAVHSDTITVLKRAVHFAELSDGAFDPSIGPLVKLWGIGSDAERVPAEHEIARVLPLVNWKDIVIDETASTVFLKQPGMGLDLGAIAKGYAADEAVRIVRAAGIKRALIDLGGNILVYGAKRDHSPWRVGIQNPLEGRGAYFGIAEVENKTLVTSGVYERFFESDGKRYHHILSTRDGYPVDQGLLSVTIIGQSSIDADALSTTLFALGYEKGSILLESLDNTEVIFVFADLSVRGTSGAFEHFTLTDDDFKIMGGF